MFWLCPSIGYNIKFLLLLLLVHCTLQVSQAELHRWFHGWGAGVIEDVRVQKDKGFGFVRYRAHDEAAYAIQVANGRVLCGKSVKVNALHSFYPHLCI
jgi:hypothetical protein